MKSRLRKLAALMVVGLIGSMSVANASAASGNASKGRSAWNKNCKSCHTIASRKGMTKTKLTRSLKNEPQMKYLKSKLKAQDILNLVAYIKKAAK